MDLNLLDGSTSLCAILHEESNERIIEAIVFAESLLGDNRVLLACLLVDNRDFLLRYSNVQVSTILTEVFFAVDFLWHPEHVG